MEYLIEKFRLKVKKEELFSYVLDPIDKSKEQYSYKKSRKVYIVKTKDSFYYVSDANSSIRTRLSNGFRAYNNFIRTGKAKNGYKGYKWIEKLLNKEAYVYVINFPSNDRKEYRKNMEALEAELVFLIRFNKGEWPLGQNEIHFYNEIEGDIELPIKEYATEIFKIALV